MTDRAALIGIAAPGDHSKTELIAERLQMRAEDISYFDLSDDPLKIMKSVATAQGRSIDATGSMLISTSGLDQKALKTFRKLTSMGLTLRLDVDQVALDDLDSSQIESWLDYGSVPEDEPEEEFDPFLGLIEEEDDEPEEEQESNLAATRSDLPDIDATGDESPAESSNHSGIKMGSAPPMPSMADDDDFDEEPAPAPSRRENRRRNAEERDEEPSSVPDGLPPVPELDDSLDEMEGAQNRSEGFQNDEPQSTPLREINNMRTDLPPLPGDEEDFAPAPEPEPIRVPNTEDHPINNDLPPLPGDEFDDPAPAPAPAPIPDTEPEPEDEPSPKPMRFRRSRSSEPTPLREQDEEVEHEIALPGDYIDPDQDNNRYEVEEEEEEEASEARRSRRDQIPDESDTYSYGSSRAQVSSARGYEEQIVEERDIDDGINFDAPPLRKGDPSYTSNMTLEERNQQENDRESKRVYGPRSYRPVSPTSGKIFYSTSSHGGAGNTTVSWILANTTAMVLGKMGKLDEQPVWLIEADYRNPKLQNRLNTDGHLGHVAEVVRRNKGQLDRQLLTNAIYGATVEQSDTGLKVVPCPYDISGHDKDRIQYAIVSAVKLAAAEGGYVFIDAGNLTAEGFDSLDNKLAHEMSHRVILVSDSGHIDDMQRTIQSLTGRNVRNRKHPEQVSIFLNKATPELVREVSEVMAPTQVDGHFPYIKEISESAGINKAWVGYSSRETLNSMVVRGGHFMASCGEQTIGHPFTNRGPVRKESFWRKILKMMGSR